MLQRKLWVPVLAVLLIAATGSAHGFENHVQPETGLVDADSPFYGLEIAVDNTAVNLGVLNPGSVAFERASEAHATNNTENRGRALDNLNAVATVASSNDTTGLDKALDVLQTIDNGADLSTAISAVQEAQDRAPIEAIDKVPVNTPVN